MKPECSLPLHKSPPLFPILNKIIPAHATPSDFLKIHFRIILISTPGSSKWSLSLRSPHQNSICTSPFAHRAKFPAQLFLLHLVTRIIFGVYRSRSSSLCSLFQIPLTSSVLGPNILLSPLFSKHPQPKFFSQCERPSFTPI